MLGPLTIRRDGVAAGAAGVAQGARAVRLSGARRRTPCRAASCASCCGTSPTIRAASCAGASARSGASSTSPVGAGSTTQATPSGSIWRTASSMRSRSPGAARGHRDDRARSGCERSPRCSPATFSKAWRSTAARTSTAGSPRSGADSAAATPRCWSSSSRALRTTRRLGYLEKWLELAPFDRRVHELLLNALARRGRIREGEEHLAATTRLFEAEGLDSAPIRDAWRSARAQSDSSAARRPAVPAATAASGSRDDDRHRCAAPRLHRGDAVRRPVRRDGRPRRGSPTRSPTT